MNKLIVIFHSNFSESIEINGDIERSCFGSLRFFPNIPKVITLDEYNYIKSKRSDLIEKFEIRKYVESKRVDKRGVTESEIDKLVKHEKLEHLKPNKQIEVLKQRGKLNKPVVLKKEQQKPSVKSVKRNKKND